MRDKNWLASEEFSRKRSDHVRRQTLNQRIAFYAKPSANGCIIWTGRLVADGYGVIDIGGVRWQVQRLVWIRAYGRIPAKHVIRHTCDNPMCINIDHLNAGTVAENMADRTARGRTARGEKHAMSRLTRVEVAAIRESIEPGKALAAKYGVSRSTIQHVIDRRTWRNVPETIASRRALQKRRRCNRLNEETVRYILAHPTTPLTELARLLSVGKPTVWAVRWRKAWKHVETPV